MKCPHCGYDERPTTIEGTKTIYHDGGHGMFYLATIELYRYHNYDHQEIDLFGCPACKKTFIDN